MRSLAVAILVVSGVPALATPDVVAVVEADVAEASRLGVTAKPYILINGAPFVALPTLENLSRATAGR